MAHDLAARQRADIHLLPMGQALTRTIFIALFQRITDAGEMVAELALTARQVQTGMMFRTNLAENAGMLFVFSVPHRASFWMKNCPLPLSAAYLDPEGVILEIHDLQPHNTNPVAASSERVQFVIEANQGWFQRHQVKEGMVVRTEHGTLLETFFGNAAKPGGRR